MTRAEIVRRFYSNLMAGDTPVYTLCCTLVWCVARVPFQMSGELEAY